MEHINEIQNVLEMIDRANKAILFHQQAQEPDLNSIDNYERLKLQHINELIDIFAQMNIPLKLTA